MRRHRCPELKRIGKKIWKGLPVSGHFSNAMACPKRDPVTKNIPFDHHAVSAAAKLYAMSRRPRTSALARGQSAAARKEAECGALPE
jgi:hypothetical protein